MTDSLFCCIVAEKIKANVVFKNDYVVVFKDINPKAPVHLLIIPRNHIACVLDIEPEDDAIIGEIFQVAAQLARDHGIAESGFRVAVNSGSEAGQSVFHLHYHLLGGRQITWPPG
jgi:histidine triad (HIT) family protein